MGTIDQAMWKFILLFLAAIPWYWSWYPELGGQIVWGMPLWFVVSVAGSLLISAVSAWQLRRPWPDELQEDEG